MAVWQLVYGHNGLGQFAEEKTAQYLDVLNSTDLDEIKILESLKAVYPQPEDQRKNAEQSKASMMAYYSQMTAKDYEDYLRSIKKPYLTIEALIESIINDLEVRQNDDRERLEKAYNGFKNKENKSKWKIAHQSERSTTFANDLNYSEHSGIKVNLHNDLISFAGPFPIFSYYGRFQKAIPFQSREYYHQYFKSVLKAFNSTFIFYTHEWSGMIDDEDEDLNSAKILELAHTTDRDYTSFHDMDSFYFEEW